MVFVNGARLPVAMCVCVCLCSSRLFGALFRCLTIKTHDNKLFVVIYTDWTCIIGYENGCRWQIHWQYELHYIRTRIRKVRERRDNERKTKRKKHNRNESMFARAQKVKQLIVGFKTVYILILPESIVGTHRAFILFGVALFRVSSPIRFNCLFAYKYRKLRLESHMHTVLL